MTKLTKNKIFNEYNTVPLTSRGNTYRTINWIGYYYNQYNVKTKTNLDNLSAKELKKIRLETYNVSTDLLEKYVYAPTDAFIKFTSE